MTFKINDFIKTKATGTKGQIKFIGRYFNEKLNNFFIEFEEKPQILFPYSEDKIDLLTKEDFEEEEKSYDEDLAKTFPKEFKEFFKLFEEKDFKDKSIESDDKSFKEELKKELEESKYKPPSAEPPAITTELPSFASYPTSDYLKSKQFKDPDPYEPPLPKSVLQEEIKAGLLYVHKIKNILKDNVLKRKIGGQKSGDIQFKRIYKINTTDRVFEKKALISDKKYNIVLCIDCSGSMRNGSMDKIIAAAKSSKMFIRTFQKFTNLHVQTFNARVVVKKPFSKKIMTENDLNEMESFIYEEARTDYSNSNFDGYCIQKALHYLKGLDGHNIIIVISDGHPSGDPRQYPTDMGPIPKNYEHGHLIQMINHANILKVPVIGIGVLTESVQKFYKIYDIINKPEEIYKSMIKTLTQVVKRI